MTLEDVGARVAEIRATAGQQNDDEAAHWMEDQLYRDVLKHFATNAPPEFADVARLALTVDEIEFSRWYA